MKQAEHFNINEINIELIFEQIIAKMCQQDTSSTPSPALTTHFHGLIFA